MTLTASEVNALKESLNRWEWLGYISTGIVFLGCVGEFFAEFTHMPKSEESKMRLSRLSLIILILGIGGELASGVKTSQLSGQIIANVEERAAVAERKAAEAGDRAATNELQTEVLRKSNLELQAKIAPRRLSSTQKQLLASRVRAFASKIISIGSVNGGTEAADYALDFKEVFSDPTLHFHVEFSSPTVIVYGGLLLRGSLQVEAGAKRKRDCATLVAGLVELGISRKLINVRNNNNPDLLALTIFPKPVE